MTIKEFLDELAELMEIEEELEETSDLQVLEEFDSLAIMASVALIDENFDIMLSGQQLSSVTTIASLINLIGRDKFSD